MKDPIYTPTGKAREYAELALNLYNGCPHRCVYCFARGIARKTSEQFAEYTAREGLFEAVREQLQTAKKPFEYVHLCFNCDPFPQGGDHKTTLRIIELIKQYGGSVQILTKGTVPDDLWLLLDKNDKFGVTITSLDSEEFEPNASSTSERLHYIERAKAEGIQTFLSCEPVLDMEYIEMLVKNRNDVDEFRIGKLNYNSDLERILRERGLIDRSWGQFGRNVEALCIKYGRKYLIKDSLRTEMRRN